MKPARVFPKFGPVTSCTAPSSPTIADDLVIACIRPRTLSVDKPVYNRFLVTETSPPIRQLH
jgi:hypothetical protein